MEPNELRIGNYVSDGVFNLKVSSIGVKCKGSINDSPLDYVFSWENIEGIPLRGRWFKYFGFTKVGKGIWCKEYGGWYYQAEKHPSFPDGYILFLDVDGVSAPPSVKIRYIHQLQNLYFALTGEEL
jgi:hypothetical protein